MDCIKKSFPCEERKKLLLCAISTFIFGIAAHAYGLLNNIFSHDSLNALYADSTENLAKVAVGRFLVPVVRVFRGPIAIPWLIGLIALAFIALSVYLVLKIFDVKSNAAAVLISGFMVTNVTVTAITATYVHELDVDMLSLFLALSAVYIWEKSQKIVSLLPAALLITASMALYQSYVEVTVTVMIMMLIIEMLEGGKVSAVFMKGLKAFLTTVAGAALYFGLNKIVCSVVSIENLDRVNVTGEYDTSFIQRLFMLIKTIAVSFLSPAGILPTVLTAGINVLIFLIIFLFVCVVLKKQKIKFGSIIFTFILIAMLPFGMNFAALFSHEGVHDVMKFSFWFVYIFAIVLLLRYLPLVNKNKTKRIVKIVSAVCAAVILWNNILVSNAAYLKKDMEHGVTMTTMNRVLDDLEEYDGFKAGETEVAFVGYVSLQKNYPGFESVSHIVGLRHTMATGALKHTEYFDPYDNLFRYFLNYPMKLSEKDYRYDPEVQAMPSYPDDGYIRQIGDTLIVKLGGNQLNKLGSSDIEKSIRSIISIFS